VRILHVLPQTNIGGAERQVQSLCTRLAARGHPQQVVSLGPLGPVGRAIAAAGVPVTSLEMRPLLRSLPRLGGLPRQIRRFRPDVVHSWMYHANMAAALATAVAGHPPLCWSLVCAEMDFARYRWTTSAVVRAGARLSRWPSAVVTNAHAAWRTHQGLGYRPRRWTLIPNGFDTDLFAPAPGRGLEVRRSFGRPDDCELIAMVARVDPMKDHATFLAALARLVAQRPRLHALVVGSGVDASNSALVGAIRRLQLGDRTVLTGPRDDVPWLMPGLDVLCLASLGEGFPNVLGEAMASGVPCVASDVGDCAPVLGDLGHTVPVRDAAAMAAAVAALLDEPPAARAARRVACRRRVLEAYGLSRMADRYEALYRELAASAATRPPEGPTMGSPDAPPVGAPAGARCGPSNGPPNGPVVSSS
jgi:glycosyltransferase involved in cell wall biosynthesis